jgi:Ni/Co efflux regulator RcnB
MKKFILAAVAASMVATPALAAPQNWQGGNHGGRTTVVHKQVYKPAPVQHRYEQNRNQQLRKWRKGERFDARYARNYRQVDYRSYRGRLRAPPRGYRYVQSGNDVVLVSIVGGLIGAVFANLIR